MSASVYGGWPGGPAKQVDWLKAMQQPGTTAPWGAGPDGGGTYVPGAMMQPYTGTDQGLTYDTFGGGGQTASASDTPGAGWDRMVGQDANAQAWLAAKGAPDPNTPAANYTPPAPGQRWGLTDQGFDTWLSTLKDGQPLDAMQAAVDQRASTPGMPADPTRARAPGPVAEPIGGGPPTPGYDNPDRPLPTAPGDGGTPLPARSPGGIGGLTPGAGYDGGTAPTDRPQTGPAQTANWGDIYGQRRAGVNGELFTDVDDQNAYNMEGPGRERGYDQLVQSMADPGSVFGKWLASQFGTEQAAFDAFASGDNSNATWTDFLTGRPGEVIAGQQTPTTSANQRQRLVDRYLQLPGWMQRPGGAAGTGFAGAQLGGYGGG